MEKRKGADGKERKSAIEKPVKKTALVVTKAAEPPRPSATTRKKGIAVFNTILETIDDLDAMDLQRLAAMSAEESLKRLKGADRKRAVEDLKKIMKKYQ